MERDRAGARPLAKFSPPRPLVQKAPSAVFRCAASSDIPALVDLRIEFLRIVKDSGLPDEAEWRAHFAALFARELASGALLVWVAEEGGRIVGASGLRLPRQPEGQTSPEGEILNMYTIRECRRRGIGSELLSLAIAEARARGLERLRLQPTDLGRPLYLRAGFCDEDRDMVLELGPVGP
jgi:ribosomal protein S18 acetylase RimI-like enzyme